MKPLLWFLAILALLVVLFCMGFWPIPTILLAGWAFFLSRVLPQMQVDWSATSTALGCFGLLILGLHAFLRWFSRHVMLQHGDSPSGPWKFRWTATILAVVLLLFLAGISAVGFTHQGVWLGKSARSLYYRGGIPGALASSTSLNNMRHLGIGSISGNPHHRHYPGVKFDPDGAALHGWLTMLLPYLEQEQLYRKLDLTLPWNHPRNAEALRTSVPVFRNYGIDERNDPEGFALSHYAGNIHILGNDVAWKTSDIPDGAGNTILAGEVSTAFRPWGYPLASRDPALGLYNTPQSFGGPRPHSGTVFAMADSSVRMISSKVDRAVLEALATPDGGEVIRDDW